MEETGRARDWALALLGPAAVCAVGVGALALVDGRTFDLAANVVDRRPRPQGAATYIREVVALDPTVVILGDSLAGTDLDLPGLGRALGVPPDRIGALSIPGSTGAHWYAVADNFVFREGRRPELLLVVASRFSMLETGPGEDGLRAGLSGLFDGDDPVIARKSGVGRWPLLERARIDRARLRAELTHRVRALPLAFGADDARVEGAIRRVFARGSVEPERVRDLVPGDLQARSERGNFNTDPAASLLPDLIALARQNGTDVVVVDPPLSSLGPEWLREQGGPEVAERLAAEVRRSGATWIDGSAWPVADRYYTDLLHLDGGGAQRFTAILGRHLRGPAPPLSVDGVAGDRVYRTEPPGVEPAARTTGPGGTLRWRMPQAPELWQAWAGVGVAAPPDCLPIEVVVRDEVLPERACAELNADAAPGACFDGDELIARVRGDTRGVTLRADPARRCGPWSWLYPGDVLQISPREAGSVLTVAVAGGVPAELTVVVRSASREERWDWRAEDPVARFRRVVSSAPTTIEVQNRTPRAPVVLTEVSLRPAGGDVVAPEGSADEGVGAAAVRRERSQQRTMFTTPR